MIYYFASTDSGAASLTGQNGALTNLLDAYLVNDGSAVTVSGITRSGSIVTVTTSAAHGLNKYQVAKIAGADQADYNGKQKVLSVPSPTTFTFSLVTTPATPATSSGGMTCKRSAVGWTIAYTATNQRVYQPPVGGNGFGEWTMALNDIDNKILFYNGTAAFSTNQVNIGAWNYAKFFVERGVFGIILNGVLEGTWTNIRLSPGTSSIRIGRSQPGVSDYFLGYIGPFRYTVGSARDRYGIATPTAMWPTGQDPFSAYQKNKLLRAAPGCNAPGHPPIKLIRRPGHTPDIYLGGSDYTAGVVTINDVPRKAFVRVRELKTGLQLTGGWTDASGNFRFDGLSSKLQYDVTAFDPITGEQAVIYDRI